MNIEELNKSKVPIIVMDKKPKKFTSKTLFNNNLEKANEILAWAGLPKVKKQIWGMNMKSPILVFVFAVFLTACSVSIDTTEFNSQIKSLTDINSPEELMRIYYGPYEVEGNSKLTITTKDQGEYKFEITLIHNGVADDSVSDIRIVMQAKKSNQTWTVLSIQKSWKCHEGRGHSYWGASKCE